MKWKCLVFSALLGFLTVGCGGDSTADHNKNLKPVTAKAEDLQGASAGAPVGKGKGAQAPNPAPKADTPP